MARLIAKTSARRLIEISAINASVKDLREAMDLSRSEIENGYGPAIVFVDEIHRFSKVQQESLLKAVEEGEIVLVGATTENPLYALTSAMLSRTTLLRLEPLEADDLVTILNLAVSDERGLGGKFTLDQPVVELIATRSGGDARKALTILEASANAVKAVKRQEITAQDVKTSMPIALARYDSTGDQHYDIISAFIKSVRGSDPDAALHWLARMIDGGEDPRFIARRLVILAAEDVGLAEPSALALANATMSVVAQIGMPEGRIPLASCTIYLALAPKSNSAYLAINTALADVREGFTPTVPAHLRSSGLAGDGGDYEYPHDLEGTFSKQSYLPTDGRPRKYFNPKGAGFESTLLERLSRLLGLKS
jgi:putative ATPase